MKTIACSVSLSLASVAVAQQSDYDVHAYSPAVVVRVATELISSIRELSPVTTGLAQTLSAESWWSVTSQSPLTYADNVLIVGVAAGGSGIVRHFSRQAWVGAYTLQSSHQFAGPIIPSGVAYDSLAQVIYVIDDTSRQVLAGAWNGSDLLAGVSWQPWYDASQSVAAQYPSLELLGGDSPGALGSLGVRTSAATELRVAPRRHSSRFANGNPEWAIVDIATQLDTGYVAPVPSGDNYLLDASSVSDGAASVFVQVGEGFAHTYELVRVDTGVVLGTVSQTTLDTGVSIPSATPLEVGVVYGVRRVGGGEIQESRCMVRYGQPGDIGATGLVTLGRLQFSGPFQSGQDLQLSCPIAAEVASPVLVATAITFGERQSGGVDPVIQIGPEHWLIDTEHSFPLQLEVAYGNISSWLIYDPISVPVLPIGTDPVFLFQSVAVDGLGGVYFSDVLGGAVLQ